MKTLVINIFAGPGAGKSTTAARVFAMLKDCGVVEQAHEWVKALVWEERYLPDQIYIFGKQQRAVRRLDGHVEAIVTDCPIPLSSIYGPNESPEFHNLVWQTFASFDNLNIVLVRGKAYVPHGRAQTEREARAIDFEIVERLHARNVPFYTIRAAEAAFEITQLARERIMANRCSARNS